MSQQSSGRAPGGTGVRTDPGTTQVARDEVAEVGRTTADAGREVAGTAAEQAMQVAQEAKSQARDLIGEARMQVRSQAQTGQQKAAETLRSLADELQQMALSGSQSGPVSEVARQAADKLTGVADWIGQREPGDLLEEFRGVARRRPGMFLLGATAAGVLAGRLTRSAAAATVRRERPGLRAAAGGRRWVSGGPDALRPCRRTTPAAAAHRSARCSGRLRGPGWGPRRRTAGPAAIPTGRAGATARPHPGVPRSAGSADRSGVPAAVRCDRSRRAGLRA